MKKLLFKTEFFLSENLQGILVQLFYAWVLNLKQKIIHHIPIVYFKNGVFQ